MTSRKRNWIQRMLGRHQTPHPPLNSPDSSREDRTTHSADANKRDSEKPESDAEAAGVDHTTDYDPLQPRIEDARAPHYPGLTADQSAELVAHVQHAFSSRGYHAAPAGQSFEFWEGVASGNTEGRPKIMGMTNLVRQVANLPNFDAAGETADAFVDSLLNAESPFDLRDADFYAGMRVRLTPISDGAPTAAREFDRDAPIRPFSDDTMIQLSLDSSVAVQAMTDATIADRGPVEDLYRMGYRNLWQELIDSDLTIQQIQPDPSDDTQMVWAITGSSYYLGSAALFLEELLHRYQPQVDTSAGLIFAMPHRHMTLVREVTNGNELMGAIGLMATLAAEQYHTKPGQISPRLHLQHLGEVETFTDVVWGNDQRQVEIQVKPNSYLMGRISEGMDGDDFGGFGPGGSSGPGGPGGGSGGFNGGPGGPIGPSFGGPAL